MSDPEPWPYVPIAGRNRKWWQKKRYALPMLLIAMCAAALSHYWPVDG